MWQSFRPTNGCFVALSFLFTPRYYKFFGFYNVPGAIFVDNAKQLSRAQLLGRMDCEQIGTPLTYLTYLGRQVNTKSLYFTTGVLYVYVAAILFVPAS